MSSRPSDQQALTWRNRAWSMPRAGLVVCVLFVSASGAEWLTGRKLAEELQRPLAATWDGVSLRVMLQRIANQHHCALVTDRRLDPTRERKLDAASQPLREALELLIASDGAGVSVLDSVVYLGPTAATRRLRTTIHLRELELKDDALGIAHSRQLDLARRLDITWADLATPREILRKIAGEFELTVAGEEHIPHDLWAGAELPHVTAAEALSLVCAQFDLTFEWRDSGRGIALVPLPERVTIPRRHTLPAGKSPAEVLEFCRAELAEAKGSVEGMQVLLTGAIEDQEALETYLRGRTAVKPVAVARPPLSRVRLTLRFRGTARQLLKLLETSPSAALTFEYDEAALRQAGVDLEKKFEFEVKNAPVPEVLKKAFEAAEIKYEQDDRTVKLVP